MAISELDKEWDEILRNIKHQSKLLEDPTIQTNALAHKVILYRYQINLKRERQLARWDWDRMMEHTEPYTDDSELDAWL